jgi:hypothetical protein
VVVRRLALAAQLAVYVLVAAGCPRATTTPKPPAGPRVEAHSDSAAVLALAAAPPFLLVASSDGLDRWDLRDGSVLHLGAGDGLPGTSVRALQVEGDAAWLVSDGGVARLHIADALVEMASAPPAAVNGGHAELAALTADGAGGAWVGGQSGLWHIDASGAWLGGGYPRPVTALWQDPTGDLLLGTPDGLVARRPDGSFAEIGAAQGVALGRVGFIVAAPDGQPVVVGDGLDQKPTLAFRVGATWHSARPSPEVRFVAGARRGNRLVLASNDRLWELSPPGAGGSRPLRREGARLVPVPGGVKAPYVLRPSDASLPPGVRAVVAVGDEVFVGTGSVGVARYPAEATRPGWLRHRDLAAGARHLSVACLAANTCYLATGGKELWRYDGRDFHAVDLDRNVTRVLAVVRGQGGVVTALYTVTTDDKLHVARLETGAFRPGLALPVQVPGPLLGLSFARFSPDGLLWVGLEYTDEEGEARPHGVATIELELGVVTYHRQEVGNYSKKTGILPVPNDVTDVAFDPGNAAERLDIWFATSSGAAHMTLPGEKLEVWDESDGLDSEILHAVAVSSGGLVYVASTRGVGTFDGEHWSFPRSLAVAASALAVSGDGRLWIGTDRGVVVYDGLRGMRVVARAGLLSEAIDDLQMDPFGRVWTLSSQGIGIISP